MVQFSSVSKNFGDVVALRDVSFSISPGGIVGLLGPNGAGKTTTMRIMTGYLEPDGGSVTIGGEAFSPDSIEAKRKIGYLPESAPVYGDMFAWDYLEFGARLHGIDPEVRVPEVIREVGLGPHAHKAIHELSKGYRQRVGLAYALLHDPELLILDEPTSGLDPNQIIEVRNLIRRVAETKTVILSTHIMQEVEALCERVIVIHEGAIRYDGSIAGFSGNAERLRVSVAGIERDRLVSLLPALPGFRDFVDADAESADENVVAGVVVTDGDVRERFFKLAVEKGFSLLALHRERTSMEDIFLQLTAENREEVNA